MVQTLCFWHLCKLTCSSFPFYFLVYILLPISTYTLPDCLLCRPSCSFPASLKQFFPAYSDLLLVSRFFLLPTPFAFFFFFSFNFYLHGSPSCLLPTSAWSLTSPPLYPCLLLSPKQLWVECSRPFYSELWHLLACLSLNAKWKHNLSRAVDAQTTTIWD